MKKISIVVPCYNEEKSLVELHELVKNMFATQLSEYDYEIVFADDYSVDDTRSIIRQLCKEDSRVKAVFNMANFGFSRNIFSSLKEATGDAVFLVFGDMQDPPELLPEFVSKWEKGSKVVIGKKKGSDEGAFMTFMRKQYYNLIDLISDKKQIRDYNGYGLYDKRFVDVLSGIEDLQPYLKAVISEYAPNYDYVEYQHHESKREKSNFNFYKNYDFAMEGVTSSTKKLMRISTFIGVTLGIISAIYAISVLIRKILFWDTFPLGTASIMIGVYMLGAIQLFFIGVLGEYMLSINVKTMKKPRVVVEERINFDKEDNEKYKDME